MLESNQKCTHGFTRSIQRKKEWKPVLQGIARNQSTQAITRGRRLIIAVAVVIVAAVSAVHSTVASANQLSCHIMAASDHMLHAALSVSDSSVFVFAETLSDRLTSQGHFTGCPICAVVSGSAGKGTQALSLQTYS